MVPDVDLDPAIFYLLETNTKLIFVKIIFCFLVFESTFTSFFKDKKSKRSHKTVGVKVFLTIFA